MYLGVLFELNIIDRNSSCSKMGNGDMNNMTKKDTNNHCSVDFDKRILNCSCFPTFE